MKESLSKFAGISLAAVLKISFIDLVLSGDDVREVNAGTSLRDAILTIVAADFVMSLDNMPVGGASHGSVGLLMSGLLISMALIMFSSSIIAKLMNRFPWLVYIGSGILAWTAGEMILDDRWLHRFYLPGHYVVMAFLAVLAAVVLMVGFLLNRRQAKEG